MINNSPISLWDASAVESDLQADFDGGPAVDVAVVGGGFTGLATALYCSEKGLSVHVLEAVRIGHGGSGRNVGLVNAGIWLPPENVRQVLGETYGPRFLKRFGQGPETVFNLIEKHQIQCEATKTGTIHAAHAPKGMKDLEARCREWQSMGEPVELLDRDEAAKLIGSDAFFGGLLDHRAGTVNPMGYCRGLARAARGAGAQISTGVRVTGLSKEDGNWLVKTTSGTVKAKAVVLGTNAYTDDLWPGLAKGYTMIHYFQLATAPLGPEADHIFPERQGLWDTGTIMFSVRRDAFDRIVIGSMGKVIGDKNSGLSARWARKQLRRIFPSIGEAKFEEAWHGQIAMTPDHLPRVHQLDENLYTAIGYNGRGITTGTIFGEAMAGLLTGMDKSELPLPMTSPSAVSSAPVMSRFYDMAFTVNQFVKSF